MISDKSGSLPWVQWGPNRVSRLVLGHNPIKGGSHFSEGLSNEMSEWFAPAAGNDLEMMARAEEVGINVCQFGGGNMHDLLRRHHARGGRVQWIATFYDMDGEPEKELAGILAVDPTPIAIQHFGEQTDTLFIDGRMDVLHDRMKMLRDTGLWIGVCTHLADVVDYVESAGWDVDFYQTCFHTTYSYAREGKIDRNAEQYEDADRDDMVRQIQRTDKPCLAFKVLAANRKCATPADVEAAMRFAYEQVKPIDIVAVGMWQKYTDQVGQNAELVRRVLAGARA